MYDFDNFCVENNLQYWVEGGTLMGALRHGGIIPWDDDIDIGVFESDYKKLSNVLKNNATYYIYEGGGAGAPKLKYRNQSSQTNKVKTNKGNAVVCNTATINHFPEGILENILKRIEILEKGS